MSDTLSLADVADFIERLTTEAAWVETQQERRSMRDLMFGQRPVNIGIDTKVQFRSPEAEDDAHAYKNRILAAPLTVNVAALRDSERAEEKARRQEKFYYRHYYHARDAGVYDPVVFDMASLGVGIVHHRLNAEALPIFPDYADGDADKYLEDAETRIKAFIEKGAGDLFEVEPIDPTTVYYPPDKSSKVYSAEIPLVTLARNYGRRGVQVGYEDDGSLVVSTLTPGENPDIPQSYWTKTVRLQILETDDYCYHIAKGPKNTESLGVYKNYFGRPGFVYCYGERTGARHPLWEFRPLIFGKYAVTPFKNMLVTALLNAGLDAAQMRYALKKVDPTAPPIEGAVSIEVTDEGVVVPPAGYELVAPKVELGVDLAQAMQLMEQIDKYGYPKSLNRPEEVQAQSGYDRARQQDAVQSLLTPPLSHYGSMHRQGFEMIGHAVSELPVPVSVRNIYSPDGKRTVAETVTLDPGDMDIDADITCDFSSITVFNQIAMQEHIRILQQADMATEDEMLDAKGVDDFDAWRKTRMRNKVEKAVDDMAVETITLINQQQAAMVMDEVLAQNATGPMVQTNEDALRADRGPSIATGPGTAMPLQPTPPAEAEMGMPV